MAQRLERLPTLLQALQVSSLPSLSQSANASTTIVPRWASKCASVIYPLVSIPVTIRLPPFFSDIWDSVLRAVPKKKTSHSKKRHRQLAGKALKDVTNLNRCSACGRMKRAYTLCPYCVQCTCRYYLMRLSTAQLTFSLAIRKWFQPDGTLKKAY